MSSETPSLISVLSRDVDQLHPFWQFCGSGPQNNIYLLSDPLVNYLIKLLHARPVLAPKVSSSEWKIWLRVLKAHRSTAYIYHCINKIDQQFAPPEQILKFMRHVALVERLHAVQAQQQLSNILRVLQEANIPVLTLKGPALAHSIYPHPGTRPHTDLDLLVPHEFMPSAYECLEAIGYRGLTKRYKRGRHFYYDDSFNPQSSQVGKCNIELHWNLCPFPALKLIDARIDGLFQRAIQISVSGTTLSTFCPVDALLYRAMNNAYIHDHDLRLIWIIDAALLAKEIKQSELWDVLLNRSVKWRCRLALEFTLTMVQNWMGNPSSSTFPEISTWPEPSPEEIRIWKKTTVRRHSLSTYLSLYVNTVANGLRCIPYVIELIFPDSNYMQSKYPPAIGWHLSLSYCRRWRRWWSIK